MYSCGRKLRYCSYVQALSPTTVRSLQLHLESFQFHQEQQSSFNFNNLRTCVHCHSDIKFISYTVQRNIIERDSNWFHSFKDGICSCGDHCWKVEAPTLSEFQID
ncbi:pentatricopeptide repeat-containing protein [Quercus suber]|uniref:Pentatricopeptide repeat-containing protein n=1 Tax=Quercus suber TaxID=58331 RepID=A0AAW0LJ38_QUESU